MSGGDAVVSRAKDVLRQYEIATRFNVQVDGRRPHEVIAELVTEVELLQGLYQDAVDLACRYNDELQTATRGVMTPTLRTMPNQPRTPHRTIRVSDELWAAAQEVAAGKGETLSDVLRRSLERYVKTAKRGKS